MNSRRFLSRFARITTSGRFISEIDGLRFIAIGTVIFFHIGASHIFAASGTSLTGGGWLTYFTRVGFHGVELFFIISGFILGLPFASHALKDKPGVNLKKYFLRRLTRLEPPYMLSLILFFFMWVFIKDANGLSLLPHLLAGLVYLHNIIFASANPINEVTWSLEVEVQFYILVPLLSAIFLVRNKTLRRSILAAICFAGITYNLFFITPGSELYLTIVRFIQFFLIGFLLADVFLLDWNEHPKKSYVWDVISFIGWPLLFVVWNLQLPVGTASASLLARATEAYAFPALAFVLYLGVFRGPIINRFFTNPWITTIGGMCYTIYLLHNHIIGLVERVSRHFVFTHSLVLNFIFQSVLIVPIVLAFSGLYFILIEKPCMRKDWPQRAYAKVRGWMVTSEPA